MAIALLTDFGTREYFVGAMKGTILSIDPSAVIIDITHEIAPQDIAEAAFTLSACYRDFPAGTIFVAVVDPGVGSERRAVAAEAGGYIFIAPDNGLLSGPIADNKLSAVVRNITNAKFFRHPVSSTFHGRDIFAPVAAHISRGVLPAELGPLVDDPVLLPLEQPERLPDGGVAGKVVHIDRFGNLITNIRPEHLPEKFELRICDERITRLSEYYDASSDGELIAVTGSTGTIEISAVRASAARLLGAAVGTAAVVVRIA